MRIMLDTNILISAIIFKSKMMYDVFAVILSEHKLVLSSYVITELKEVITRKCTGKSTLLDEFLTVLPYEFVYTPDVMNRDLFKIRDEMDYPVLYTAIIEDVDILLTGDKDFMEVEVEKPEILTPSEFLVKYM